MGNYLCLIFPLFFVFDEKKMKVLALVVVTGVLLSKSVISIGIMFLMFVILALFIRRSKFVLYGLAIIIILSLYLIIKNIHLLKFTNGFDGRFGIWGQSITYLKHNPLFGQGAGIYKIWEIKPINSIWLNAHNDWLERTIEFGFIGLFLMVLIVMHSIRNFNYKSGNRVGICYLAVFISFLMIMPGSFPMEIAPVALTGLISFWAVEKF